MKQEKVLLSFIMVIIGLVVAGIAFYLYQSSKTVDTTKSETIEKPLVSPTPDSSFFLQVNQPTDEQIVDKKTISVSGKTDPSATVAILTTSNQEVISPSKEGDFSTTVQIDEGVNYIKIQAILPNGEIKTVQRVVSYTTEDF